MPPAVAKASLADSLRFNLLHVIPLALQGTFRRRPFFVRWVGRLHPDPLGRRFVARLRAKHRADYVDLRMLFRRTRLVLDPVGVRATLERSPAAYGAPKAKRDGMIVFQPDAVTLAGPPHWPPRRRFNEMVLRAALTPPIADRLAEIVRDEVGRWRARNSGRLVWDDLKEVFDRLTLRLVFGDAARGDDALLAALDKLMARANRVVFRRRSESAFAALNEGISRYWQAADPLSLVGAGARLMASPTDWPGGAVPPADVIRPEGQAPHWLFAMKDTLAANTAFALALVATHPEALAGVLDGSKPGYTEACVQEAMRLWPTTPMLLREATGAGVLGEVHAGGLQVLIWNAAGHRDAATVPEPDRFRPERWAEGDSDWRFNHLSNGPQGCAGKDLALRVAGRVLAEVLGGSRLTMVRPSWAAGGPLPEAFDWFAFRADAAPL